MSDNYIHLGDFEKFVRDRFKAIIEGKGSIVPRIAVKLKLDEIFSSGVSQPSIQADAMERCDFSDYKGSLCPMCSNTNIRKSTA